MKVIYLDDYKLDEELLLKEMGVDCVRLSLNDVLGGGSLESIDSDSSYTIRGNRLPTTMYTELYKRIEAAGASLGSSPKSFEIGESFALQYPLLGDLSPGAIVVNAEDSTASISRILQDSEIRFPLFVRSEIESAAKYVGVEGCVVSSAQESEVASVVNNLRMHVNGFRSLIFKEMAKISTHPPSKRALEYRAIGVRGQFLFFDFEEDNANGLPDPELLGLRTIAKTAFANLSKGGADGDYFLDVAITDDKPIVVECKNLLNGTIKAINKFGSHISHISSKS